MQDDNNRAVNLLQFWLDVQVFKELHIPTQVEDNLNISSVVDQASKEIGLF